MLDETLEVRAAQIAEEVISAYNETGWTPEDMTVGGPGKDSGCAVGVLAFRYGLKPSTAMFPWFKDQYGLAGARFAVGFDHGLTDRDPLPQDAFSVLQYAEEYLVGLQVGQTVRAWWELRNAPEASAGPIEGNRVLMTEDQTAKLEELVHG